MAEIKIHLKNYGSVATVHGFGYLAEDGRLKLERILWLCVVVLAMLFCYY